MTITPLALQGNNPAKHLTTKIGNGFYREKSYIFIGKPRKS